MQNSNHCMGIKGVVVTVKMQELLKVLQWILKAKISAKRISFFYMKNHYGADVSLKNKGNYEGIITFNTEKKKGLQFRFTFFI